MIGKSHAVIRIYDVDVTFQKRQALSSLSVGVKRDAPALERILHEKIAALGEPASGLP